MKTVYVCYYFHTGPGSLEETCSDLFVTRRLNAAVVWLDLKVVRSQMEGCDIYHYEPKRCGNHIRKSEVKAEVLSTG